LPLSVGLSKYSPFHPVIAIGGAVVGVGAIGGSTTGMPSTLDAVTRSAVTQPTPSPVPGNEIAHQSAAAVWPTNQGGIAFIQETNDRIGSAWAATNVDRHIGCN
jgi:hypothetical protein